jgi:hypothetical protein
MGRNTDEFRYQEVTGPDEDEDEDEDEAVVVGLASSALVLFPLFLLAIRGKVKVKVKVKVKEEREKERERIEIRRFGCDNIRQKTDGEQAQVPLHATTKSHQSSLGSSQRLVES